MKDKEVKYYDKVTDFTVPPWERYPELQYRSMGWRMGYGEYYIHRWRKYYFSLPESEREEYKAANPEIRSWSGFYSSLEALKAKRDMPLNGKFKT